ncbi:VOC family protein [Silvibacterium acidisoli]|uniref:VOC family protein n=1 Tax=Acidobacteriaceae bacterium ZG23-2 TaxID=2883246 RepID=UPI00406CFE84
MATPRNLIGFVPTADGARARAFYEQVLGLHFVSDDQFAIVFRSEGNMIRIAKMESFTPAPYTVLGWEVSDIEDEVKRLADKGVAFERYAFLTQDASSIWEAPGGAKVAWFKDPDGNVLSLSQHP